MVFLVVGAGSEVVLVLAWSDLLDLFADGASDVLNYFKESTLA